MKYVLLVILGLFLVMVIINGVTPTLGVENGRLKPLKNAPNGVSSQTEDKDKFVDALMLHEGSIDILLSIIRENKGLLVTSQPDYIHVIFSTRIGFRDDVEFYLSKEEGLIHYRSQSRLGYSDMGLNKKRYEMIKDLYMEKIPQ